jgi:hypothetical protein
MRDTSSRCQACGVRAETRYVEFYQNIGAIIIRFSKCVRGDLCKSCIHRYFWEVTSINLMLGWWGIISFFLNIGFIINNVVRYLSCLNMAPVDQGPGAGASYGYGGEAGRDGTRCPHCGRIDDELERRGYCLHCNRDL